MEKETESELAKSNFLARMSHEMRTPLNAIIGMSTIAQTSSDLMKIHSCLVKINEASAHLLGMINDILDLAKIAEGNLKLINAEFDLIQMLRKITDSQKFMLDAKKLQLVLDFDPDLPEIIVGDEQRLAQVLDNFLSNAVKFTHPEGIITLTVKKLVETEKTCTLSMSVSDTGIGISKDKLKTIFMLFEQVDGSIARKYGGSGMGLAISASIVYLMGGEIRVASEPGKGSYFGFDVTFETGSNKAAKAVSSAKTRAGETLQARKLRFEGISILLAEDVEINRDIVTGLLEDSGLSIDIAEDGMEALQKYKAAPLKYALILMDVHMPGMDGLEAARQIRAFEKASKIQYEQIPITAMTANVYNDDIEKCLAAGMTSHLSKPINYDELMIQLEKYLNVRHTK